MPAHTPSLQILLRALCHSPHAKWVPNLERSLVLLWQYRLSSKQLRSLLHALVQHPAKARQALLPSTIRILHGIATQKGPGPPVPTAWFDFDLPCSGLRLPPLLNWPSSEGYSISTWVRVESWFGHTDGTAADTTPFLLSLLTSTGKGIEVFFRQGALVLQVTPTLCLPRAPSRTGPYIISGPRNSGLLPDPPTLCLLFPGGGRERRKRIAPAVRAQRGTLGSGGPEEGASWQSRCTRAVRGPFVTRKIAAPDARFPKKKSSS